MTMTDTTPAPSPSPSLTPAAAKLAEAIEKAGASAAAAQGLRFVFDRGHEMSGIVRFEVDGDGRFQLTRTAYKKYGPVEFQGQLSPEQIQELYGALARARILGIESSSRPIGDDEQPIALEVGNGRDTAKLRLWAKDARDNPQFSEFTNAFYPLLQTLSDGQIRLRP